MAWQIIATNQTVRLELSTTDSATVVAGVSVSSATGTAINSDGSSQQIFVHGSVTGSNIGIYLGTSATSNNLGFIGTTGIVSGGTYGIILAGTGNSLVNYGMISSGDKGILLSGDGSNDKITNYGTIFATATGIESTASGSGTITLKNYGTITGGDLAYEQTSGFNTRDNITNRGIMNGDVELGAGDDSFLNLGSGVVNGRVYGGAGSDYFRLGAGEDTIYGGNDMDFLDFSRGSGVKFTLEGSFDNTGLAAGDYIREVEGVYGSLKGSDYIKGDAQANYFHGFGGTDSLYGGSNNDTLVGGTGKDILYGGTGNDVFYFNDPSEGGDKISDFTNKTGNNDSFQISYEELALAGIIGPRALLASEFYKGSTNICTGTEDRIILRTTDNTVWFDSNGKASGGLTMLADLQSGATLTYSDFSFV